MTTTDIDEDLRRMSVAIRVRYLRRMEEIAIHCRRDRAAQAAILLEHAIANWRPEPDELEEVA